MEELQTPDKLLLAAAERGDFGAIRHCLQDGADVNAADLHHVMGCGYTALHYAADADSPELVRLLIGAGAMVDARDVTGATPLWRACNAGRLAAARELLASGADPNARNADGYSCLGRVCRPWFELANLLRSYGAIV